MKTIFELILKIILLPFQLLKALIVLILAMTFGPIILMVLFFGLLALGALVLF